jgi:ferrous iron transport protein B
VCVPVLRATRTLEHRRERLLTIAMAPFVSCGARLPVYVLFAAAFLPQGARNVVFGLYLIGVAVAVLTGPVLRCTVLQGEATPFIMELPRPPSPDVERQRRALRVRIRVSAVGGLLRRWIA